MSEIKKYSSEERRVSNAILKSIEIMGLKHKITFNRSKQGWIMSFIRIGTTEIEIDLNKVHINVFKNFTEEEIIYTLPMFFTAIVLRKKFQSEPHVHDDGTIEGPKGSTKSNFPSHYGDEFRTRLKKGYIGVLSKITEAPEFVILKHGDAIDVVAKKIGYM